MLEDKRKIAIIALLALLMAFVAIEMDDLDVTTASFEYINASKISSVGLTSSSGDNVSLISEINNGIWYGNESNGVPWAVYIEFHNVTRFDFVESFHKYYSTSGTPSTHVVSRSIWCPLHSDWVELEEFTNQNITFYHTKSTPDSNHFIMTNETVVLRYDHVANGNVAHQLQIDTSRLIKNVATLSHG